MMTLAGTVASEVFEVESVTVVPPAGAAIDNETEKYASPLLLDAGAARVTAVVDNAIERLTVTPAAVAEIVAVAAVVRAPTLNSVRIRFCPAGTVTTAGIVISDGCVLVSDTARPPA